MSYEKLPDDVTGVSSPARVADAFSERQVNLALAGEDRDAVLHELVTLIVPPHEKRLSEKLFHALKERETLCPTCVNEGVAIPHSRNALVGLVDQPAIAYGRHRKGIDFGALDGVPVQHFFLLCAPSVRQHLPLLARLSRILNNPGVRLRMSTVASATEFIQLMTTAEELIS